MTLPKLNTRKRRMVATSIIVAVLAAFIVLSSSVEAYFELTRQGEEIATLWQLMRWPSTRWVGWVILAPFCFELGWKYRLTRERWVGPLAILFLGGATFYGLHVVYQLLTMLLPVYRMVHDTFGDALQFHLISSLHINIFFYWCLIAAAQLLHIHQDTHRKALGAARLESELAKARLDALKMQLHPHFLFNTLNGITTLMYRDVETADRMISRLSAFLRHTLDRSNDHLITLGEELDFLREYLSIEQLRFGDDLRVNFQIEDELKDMLVPSFVFQPLVENAIKHGIGPMGNKGTISISARRSSDSDSKVVLSVEDDGAGLQDLSDGAGLGLSNLHDRLDQLYGSAYTLEIMEAVPAGVEVRVILPLGGAPATRLAGQNPLLQA